MGPRQFGVDLRDDQPRPADRRVQMLDALADADLWPIAIARGAPAPLWWYVLREAELLGHGQHLGPVGGRIVAEVIHGLIDLDPRSFLHAGAAWTPSLPRRAPDTFTMRDLLEFADSI
jgi:hypothetical protein